MSNKTGRKIKDSEGIIEQLRNSIVSKPTTRRDFLKMAGAGGAGLLALGLTGCSNKDQLQQNLSPSSAGAVYVPDAKSMVIHDPSRCVGCRRCEIVCTIAHDGKTQPSLSRVKVARNNQFGPEGPRLNFATGHGLFGDFSVIADTCLQCPHPVPCMTACPAGAIELDTKTNARIVNATKCTGCQTCLKACPWAMPTFDADTKKATKCDLCGGDPQCVKWCASGALSYVPWRDRTRETPARQAVPAYIGSPAGVAESCAAVGCHPVTK